MTAKNKLTANFGKFFTRINPSPSYRSVASSAYNQVKSLLESPQCPAAELGVKCYLQGSYDRETAIHAINDIDVVAICSNLDAGRSLVDRLLLPTGRQYTRDQIFFMIAGTLQGYWQYKGKVGYRGTSLCIKLLLDGVKVEILPAVRQFGHDTDSEPFYIWRPTTKSWTLTYARQHQVLLSRKNEQVGGMFIPMIKVLKHIRSVWPDLTANEIVSFHLECLLYRVRDRAYDGSPADVIENVLSIITEFSPLSALLSGMSAPCGDRQLFSTTEWSLTAYSRFHRAARAWHRMAKHANSQANPDVAIDIWKKLLGDTYFPREVK